MAKLQSQVFFSNRFQSWQLLPVIALICSCGCDFVVEKRTLVVDLADTTDEIRFLYLDEGVSVRAQYSLIQKPPQPAHILLSLRDSLKEQAKGVPDSIMDSIGPVAELLSTHMKIEDSTNYIDSGRARPLCTEQRVTIGHRDEVVEALNARLNTYAKSIALQPTESILKELNALRTNEEKRLRSKENRGKISIGIFGFGQLAMLPGARLAILKYLDEASINRAKESIAADHDWVRHTSGAIELVIPVTFDCARRLVDDKTIKHSIQEIQRVVSPVRVEARVGGIAIILGGEDKPLTCTLEDKRPVDLSREAELFRAAGGEELLKLRGLHRDGRARIDQFLRRSSTLRRVWKSADNQFKVEATLEELTSEVATLKRIDNGRVLEIKRDRLHPDVEAWLKSEEERIARLTTLESDAVARPKAE